MSGFLRLSVDEVVRACEGVWLNSEAFFSGDEISVTGVSTDSRTTKPGDLFIPFSGKNVDGHNYIRSAARQGAVCALTERGTEQADVPLIWVDSTKQALQRLAVYYRGLLGTAVTVVAVTGSVGKTTTKDMIASVLSQRFKIRKTHGNMNNDIGMPMTIMGIEQGDETVVLEMGMNHAGEIRGLSRIAKPDICVFTNIGDAHIENFGSRDNILKAKIEMLEHIKPGGTIIFNGSDRLLSNALLPLNDRYTVICCGESTYGVSGTVNAASISKRGLYGVDCSITFAFGSRYQWSFQTQISVPGEHMVMNALIAAAVGATFGMHPEAINEGIRRFVPYGSRMDIIRANGITVINDVYNANPTSMRAAVDVLTDSSVMEINIVDGRTVCILGDMLELGEFAESLHKSLGAYIAQKHVDLLICVGSLARCIYDGYKDNSEQPTNGKLLYFSTSEALIVSLQSIIQPNDHVLVKASRSMAFEHIVKALTA